MSKDTVEKTTQLKEGEPWDIPKNDEYFYIGCCDCNLTHRVEIQNRKTTIRLKFWRDERRTSQRRRRAREKGSLSQT